MPADVHLKIDTGMNRIGLKTMEELAVLLDRLRESQWVRLEGVFTHFATADEAELSFSRLPIGTLFARGGGGAAGGVYPDLPCVQQRGDHRA